ncbi:tyrosine-type recombinase/integrase [Rathayibacter soli]|uniref:tyrosine-type recombinase/integrase n=1 Tax=Rathayibacter soli TaxID=3144168 RepID=UPI0027E3BC1F|nr:tyrosine-type recombinase/integrase [Glaciibacter superstes]
MTVARAWITDRWSRSETDSTTGAKTTVQTAQHGKGSRWRVDWYEMQIDGSKKLRSRSLRTKSLAEDFLAKTENDIRSGSYRSIEHGRKTVAAVAEQWLNSKKRVKDSTRFTYERDLRMWVNPKFGAQRIGSIETHEIEQWITELQQGTAPRAYLIDYAADVERGKLSPASIARLHTVLSSVLGYAVRNGWLAVNPARGVELPTVSKAGHVYLTYGEVESLADAALIVGGESNRALIHLLAYSGLRINEALALTIDQLNLPAKRATIRQGFTLGNDGKRKLDTPKGHKSRVVPIQPFIVDELADLTEGRPASSFVFQSSTGGAIHDHNWRAREWRKAVLGCGLDGIGLTPHKLRHTAASMAISAGADVKLVQQMLGHKDASETLNTYGHLWPDRLDEVANKVEKARRKALKKLRAPKSS